MTALDYCNRNIVFRESSVISGGFQIEKYRFLEKPLLALSNPNVRQMVVYKAASCMGSVLASLAICYRIERELGHMQFVAQTDEHAAAWTVKRGKPFVLRVKGVEALIPRNEKGAHKLYAITNTHWGFVHKWMKICGPGESNQQSEQVRFVITDESHLSSSFPDGTLAAFDKRMGGAWNRASLHVTTAANKGQEVDLLYHDGTQNEMHLRCLNCHELYWPLWEDDAKEYYNGQRVFVWKDHQSDTMTLESLREICPYCSHEHRDDMQTRYSLQTDGDYIQRNPNALLENQSFRWSCFAYYPIPRKEVLSGWLEALKAERLGDLKPMEDVVKKRLCMSYTPTLHSLGENASSRDYKAGSVWITNEPILRTGSFDVQDEGGFHLWGLVEDYRANGHSRRVAYSKLSTWAHAKAMIDEHRIDGSNVAFDAGHKFSETLGKCAEWGCFAFLSTDEREFFHKIDNVLIPNRFYSEKELQDSLQGKALDPLIRLARKKAMRPVVQIQGQIVRTGLCITRKWSKQNVGMLLMRLKSGEAGRYFGIASDLSEDYIQQLHSYVETMDTNKKYGTESLILKQVKHHDHAFSTTSQSLILAMVAGFFPLAITSGSDNMSHDEIKRHDGLEVR